jgi:hypothetical protein
MPALHAVPFQLLPAFPNSTVAAAASLQFAPMLLVVRVECPSDSFEDQSRGLRMLIRLVVAACRLV